MSITRFLVDSLVAAREYVLKMLESRGYGQAKLEVYGIALTAVACCLGYAFLRTLYLLYLHPLSRYPGPFWGRVSPLRNVYQAWRRRQHLDLYELHEQYGPIVRHGPNLISINEPSALQAIYGFKANTRKSDFYTAFHAVPGAVSTHTAMNPEVHARKRRVMSAAFSDAALKSVEKYVLPHISDFLSQLKSGGCEDTEDGWRDAVDISTLDARLTFDVMGDLAYGKPFGVLGLRPENRRAMMLLGQASRLHNINGCMPFLKHSGLDRILFRKEYLHRKEFLAFSKKQMAARMADRNVKSNSEAAEPRKDFFYYIQNSKDAVTGQGFSPKELWGESNTIIIAGSDTTATSTTCTLFYILHNPQCLQEVVQEIRDMFDSLDEIVQGPKLNSCTYLRACIDEAMRMSPAVGIALERVVGPGGLEVMPGHHVPEGTLVGAPIYPLHHHRDYVRDPFTYDPNRWLHESGNADKEEDIAKLRSVFNPFSIGPRSCIGKPMAYMEMKLTLARLLWSFDIRLPRGPAGKIGMGGPGLEKGRERANEFQLWQDFVAEAPTLKIDVRPR